MDRNRRQHQSKWSLAARILAERRAILARLAARDRGRAAWNRGPLAGDNTPTSDFMEAAQESLAKEIELASREALVARLSVLARAEEKIRQGSYGRCDVCCQPIPPARLRAVPEAVFCVPCANRAPAQPSIAGTQRRSRA
ncbi:MAG: TraR/DksA C4-type zinc finger protein [candidate division NC10 bacterium]|nr:TraR/DksA C4-type zinc finger protein [candidate division NC10 bacterium]